jgi:hypothetical protein
MSNTRRLTTIHGGGAFPSRPKYAWRGYRPPRSSRRQWEDTQRFLAFQKAQQQNTIRIGEEKINA